MNYTIIWLPDALRDLATVWMASSHRNAVTAAAAAIDHVIAVSPDTAGVVVFDTVREHTIPPLRFEFEVIDATRTVFVLTVWETASGRPAPSGN